MFGHSTIAALAALTLVSATTNFTIDPDEVTITTRASWCVSQQNICNLLCGSETSANSCAEATLTYSCTCTNGTTPDVSLYMDSLPFFICEQAQSDCIDDHPNDAQGQSNCTKTYADNCGTLNASEADTGSSSSGSSATSAVSSGATASATASSSSNVTSSETSGASPATVQRFANVAAAMAIGLFAYAL